MHELALLTSVVQAVEKACRQANGAAAQVVALRVGSRSGANAMVLDWAWPLASAGSLAQGAQLVIEEIPAAIWCPACRAEREIDDFYALRCPRCAAPTAELVRGREFEVSYVELEVPDHR